MELTWLRSNSPDPMIGESPERRALLALFDFGAATAAFLLAVRIRFGDEYVSIWSDVLELPSPYLMAPTFGVLTVLVFSLARVYRPDVRFSLRAEIGEIMMATLILGLVGLSLLFLFKYEDVSRWSLVGTFFLLIVSTVLARAVARWLPPRTVDRSGRRRALLVGANEAALSIVVRLEHHRHLGVELIGLVGNANSPELERIKWLGAIADLPDVLAQEVVDEVIICLDMAQWSKLPEIVTACEQQGKTVRIPVDFARELSRGRVEDFDGLPILSLLATPHRRLGLATKRLIDIVSSAVLLVLLSPVLATAATAIAVIDGRPILYRQRRGGLNGRPFTMVKFRTMVNGAAGMRAELLGRNERTGPIFKIAKDPRITKLGRILRKASIDEIPQLWNVLTGQMSLVGPRPQPLEEVEEYDLWHRRRLSMRPGITGLWQITARHDPTFDRWMGLDLEYIDQWSLWRDLKILARTPAALLKTPGV